MCMYKHDLHNRIEESEHQLNHLAKIGQISAGIAHEIRNPLTAVKGFLQLLQKEISHKYLDMAYSELNSAILTLQDLLDVSKPNSESEQNTPLHLCSEVDSVLSLFQDKVYQIKITKNYLDHQLYILGKRNQLRKALFNLIKNALESIPDQGKIVIEHKCLGDYVYLSITDTGTGIPKDKLSLLGSPFFTTKMDGTGLGLTQVFHVMEEHQAIVEVDSYEGEGTTFTLRFPKG